MKKTRDSYWNDLYSQDDIRPKYDLWLSNYEKVLEKSKGIPIIDLGCGVGNNTLYLIERGYDVSACDLSNEALKKVNQYAPKAKTFQFDMTEGLPFPSTSALVVIADLSLHYFSFETSKQILDDIQRVLVDDGTLLCRVNSVKDVNYGANSKENAGERNFFLVDGQHKRFFDEQMIIELFDRWKMIDMKEYEMNRYKLGKVVWELSLKKKP